MNLRRAGFDGELGSGDGFSSGFVHVVDDSIVGGIGPRSDVAHGVTAFAVEEFRARVAGEVVVEALGA